MSLRYLKQSHVADEAIHRSNQRGFPAAACDWTRIVRKGASRAEQARQTRLRVEDPEEGDGGARNQVEHTINERKILEEIDFPFLCRLEFAFQTDDKLYLGMQFIAGGPLFFHLQQVEVFSFYYPVSSLLGGASAFLRGGGDSGHRISPQSPYHLSVATECVCHVAI